jgi:hypothetical protein
MSTGIKPKHKPTSIQYDDHTPRYVYYPLSNLDFAGTQFLSPIYNPKFPKGRVVLLESFEYRTQVVDQNEQMNGSNGIQLGYKIMGTANQVNFLMGNSDGAGYMTRGMTALESLTGIDAVTAAEVEAMILPKDSRGNISVPETLLELKDHFSRVRIEGENPVAIIARKTAEEMANGVNRAINYCRQVTAELEKELADGMAGRPGIRSIDPSSQYYFQQIEKPLPQDRASVAGSTELAKVLSQVLAPQSQGIDLEAQANKDLIDKLQRELAERDEMINLLTATETEEETKEVD